MTGREYVWDAMSRRVPLREPAGFVVRRGLSLSRWRLRAWLRVYRAAGTPVWEIDLTIGRSL